MSETCPKCGSETEIGWWLRWCANTKKCKWSRLMPREEREREHEALVEEIVEEMPEHAIIQEVQA